jgi:hypothetical protein
MKEYQALLVLQKLVILRLYGVLVATANIFLGAD